MGLLQLLAKLFGKSYLNKIMGTRTNVAKPIKMDRDSPFKQYSDEAFEDPKTIDYIEAKLNEYGPYALSNKNSQELANFEANAKKLLQAKMKQTGTTPGMVDSMKPRPEAEIIDIGTGKKIDDEGIMTLKERAPQIDTKASANLEEDIAKLTDRQAREYSANIESFRRPIIRQLLLKDTKIKLPDDVRKSLENKADLQRGADPKMDPLRLLDEYYDWNVNKLDELEDIRFTARDEFEAADEFLKKGGLEPKKNLADKLKDLPDDIDPDGLANGGRPGYAFGTGLKLFNLFKAKKTNVAKEIKRSIDNIFPTGDSKYDADVVVDEIMEHLNIDRDAVDGYDISDLYGQAYEAITMKAVDGVTPKLMQSIRKGADEDIKLSYTDKDKRIIPEGTTEEEIDLAILKGNFLRKYEGKIDSQLSKAIENDTNAQRVKEVIAEVEQASIMQQKGMGAEEIVNSLLDASNRKKNADGGLNYLMGL